MVNEFHANPANRTAVEDQLADLCGLEAGDVLIYCPHLDMGMKYARMLVEWKSECKELKDIDDPATKPALQAILTSHELLWGLHVFVVRSGREDEKTWENLRDLCGSKFAPGALPEDRARRFQEVLRRIVKEQMGQGTAGQADSVSRCWSANAEVGVIAAAVVSSRPETSTKQSMKC